MSGSVLQAEHVNLLCIWRQAALNNWQVLKALLLLAKKPHRLRP